ncbi:hypothetical protein [Celeribacter indicus]|uniref:hypothetical protein n=1 Tax=Celeribacter indicus TaxID=1208324 RepID=UPI001184AB97|nr:hypothetical protein [Celeribacter indicus]
MPRTMASALPFCICSIFMIFPHVPKTEVSLGNIRRLHYALSIRPAGQHLDRRAATMDQEGKSRKNPAASRVEPAGSD